MFEILPKPEFFSVSCSLAIILTSLCHFFSTYALKLLPQNHFAFCEIQDPSYLVSRYLRLLPGSTFPYTSPSPLTYHSFPFWSWEYSLFFHPYLSSNKLWSLTLGLSFTIRPLRAYFCTTEKHYFLQLSDNLEENLIHYHSPECLAPTMSCMYSPND